jgi:hypothetical protein
LNPRPAVYKTAALPLSYASLNFNILAQWIAEGVSTEPRQLTMRKQFYHFYLVNQSRNKNPANAGVFDLVTQNFL